MRVRFRLSAVFRVFQLAAGLMVAAAVAFAAGPAAAQTRPPAAVHPTWGELNPGQREALAPLSGDWDKFEPERKKKWLEVAKQYPHLSPDGQQHVHERMGELARMTPQERVTTRENFRRAYELPLAEREALVQKYQELPPDRKAELANRPRTTAEPPRKPTRDAKAATLPKAAATVPAPPK
jgi:hypothetical protein